MLSTLRQQRVVVKRNELAAEGGKIRGTCMEKHDANVKNREGMKLGRGLKRKLA